MAKPSIYELIDDLDQFIVQCKTQALSSNRVIVPKDEVLKRIREIRMKLPSEVERSSRVVQKSDVILKEAHEKAEQIKIAANEEAQRRISQTEIMKQAMEQAKLLINQANEKAQEIIGDAVSESNTIRVGALHYTNGVMKDLSDFTANVLQEEIERFQNLVDVMSGQYEIIETNRKQIAGQIASGEIPQDEEEKRTGSVRTSVKPAPKMVAPKVGQQEAAAAAAKPAKPAAIKPEQPTTKPQPPVTAPPQRKEEPMIEEELDELDELYLDEF